MAATKREQRDGYQFKTRETGRTSQKLPFFCPVDACKRATTNLDDKFLRAYGMCADCYINNVEDRKCPILDVVYYRERLAKRGY